MQDRGTHNSDIPFGEQAFTKALEKKEKEKRRNFPKGGGYNSKRTRLINPTTR